MRLACAQPPGWPEPPRIALHTETTRLISQIDDVNALLRAILIVTAHKLTLNFANVGAPYGKEAPMSAIEIPSNKKRTRTTKPNHAAMTALAAVLTLGFVAVGMPAPTAAQEMEEFP